jgi:hypothetical protein
MKFVMETLKAFLKLKTLGATVLILVCAGSIRAQQLEITSPAPNTIFAPGENITVTVSVTGSGVLAVQVGAQDIGFTGYQTTTPYSFTLTVPLNTVGLKRIFAVGLTGDEKGVVSPAISIDVEPSTQPNAIQFEEDLVAFGYVGDQKKVPVDARFSNGAILDISGSTRLKLSSSDPSIVSMDRTQMLTAASTGDTTITASYENLASTMRTIGPTSVKGDLNADGVVSVEDLLLLESMLGASPTGANDARDLDKNGKIDDADVQALLLLCGSGIKNIILTNAF